MADLATLGVIVGTQGVREATRELDGLANSGRKAEVATQKLDPQLKKASISAGQLANATRQLPAQFTDIATGLASGQRPLQVLLQQGGQIKDAFGGAGLALRAMAGYVASLINPVTILAGAAIGLALAWKQGSDEAVAFNKALILTGNAAGTTADALADAAARIDEVAGTQRSAASALAAVASTGRFTAEQVEQVAIAAEQLRIATGKSIEDTVAEFVKLEGDPVRAILKLNETQNFLTLEIYEQIKSLQDLGREQDAAALAISTYANEIGQRTGDIEQNLGFLETAWNGVKSAASEAWDAMLSVGRENTAAEQVAKLQESITSVQNREGVFYRDLTDEAADRIIARFQAQIDKIQGAQTQAAEDAAKEGASARANALAIALDQEVASYATAEEKRAQKIAEIRGKANEAVEAALAAGNQALVDSIRADEAKIVAAIEAQGKDKPARSRPVRVDNTAERERQRLLREAENAERSLGKIINQNAASLAGPAAQAARNYADELLNLVGIEQSLAAAGLLNEDRLREIAIAREQAAQSYQAEIKAINDLKTPAQQLLDDLEFELSLLGKTNVEREKAIALRYANANAASEEGKKIGAAIEELERTREITQALDDFRFAFEDNVASVLDGTKSIKDAFEDFADSIIAQIARIIAQNLTASLFGQPGQAGGGQFGDQVASFLGSFLGGGRAIGGPVSKSNLYQVGEKGEPELLDIRGKQYLIPGSDGKVTPIGEGGMTANVVNQTIQVTGTIDQRSAYQVQREAQLRLQMAANR